MAYKQLNDPEVFVEFWEEMAASIKLLNHTNEEPHYYAADLNELKDAFRSKIQSPCLVSMCLSSNPVDGKSHVQERVQTMLWVIAKEDRADDEAKLTVLSLCKSIVYKILGRMRKYRDELEIPGWNLANVRIYQVNNIEVGWHGYAMEMPILVPVTSEVNYNSDDFN